MSELNIPDLHPFIGHFAVGLLIIAVVIQLIVRLLPKLFQINVKEELSIMAKWSLWIGVGFALLAVMTGFLAYYTVSSHGPLLHHAMDWHRNWALFAFGLFLILGIWTYLNVRKVRKNSYFFLLILFLGGIAITETARRGGELVYEYGIGVEGSAEENDHPHSYFTTSSDESNSIVNLYNH